MERWNNLGGCTNRPSLPLLRGKSRNIVGVLESVPGLLKFWIWNLIKVKITKDLNENKILFN